MTRFKMQRPYFYVLIFLIGIFVTSCNEDDSVETEGIGYLSISPTSTFDEVLWDNITLTVFTEDSVEVLSYASLPEVPSRIDLPVGVYYVEVRSNNLIGSVLGIIIFEVTDLIEISQGAINEVDVPMTAQARYINLTKTQDGEEGGDNVIFTLNLSDINNEPIANDFDINITLNFSLSDASEFVDPPSSISIPVGSSSTEISLEPVDDSSSEGTQTITATVSNNNLGSLRTATAEATLTDNEVGLTQENFEGATWPADGWVATGGRGTGGNLLSSCAFEGSVGISFTGQWYLNETIEIGDPGDAMSIWVKPGSGRFYLGFGATTSGAWSVVAAPNSSQLIVQRNAGYGFSNLQASPQTWTTNKWYRMEVVFGNSNQITANLYDSDGTTLINTFTTTLTGFVPAGVVIRSFSNMCGDLIETTFAGTRPLNDEIFESRNKNYLEPFEVCDEIKYPAEDFSPEAYELLKPTDNNR